MRPEPEVFARFFTHWEPQVRRYLIWLEGDLAVIDDAAQETMISAHRYWGRVSQVENTRAWLFKIARQRLGDAQEARRRHGVSTDPCALPDRSAPGQDPLSRLEDQMAVLEAVRKLPQQQATAIALQLQFDPPLDEIADIMRISVGSVKSHLHHARRTLQQMLGEGIGGER
ncbi:RNA polymerase sigma factor [Streptomyces melanogenes]|uniref:RNA polymerase sigma factor n=1 Tax=Streptomyces melanogenes TaxID=67326 RepID=UPI00167DD15A|nr:sigma-70 family RNA polymerase sigma factor [Streptomyces melanogenes]GGP77986.1 hypothetical protein GCM10010278_65440 [Streptomyces melanogenes]